MNKWFWLFLSVITLAGGYYFFFSTKTDTKAPSSVAPPEEFVPPAEGTAPQNIPSQADAPLLPSKPIQQENNSLPPTNSDHPGTTTPVVPTPANPNDFAPLDNSQFPPPEYPPQDNFDPTTIPPPVFPDPVQGDGGEDYIQPPQDED